MFVFDIWCWGRSLWSLQQVDPPPPPPPLPPHTHPPRIITASDSVLNFNLTTCGTTLLTGRMWLAEKRRRGERHNWPHSRNSVSLCSSHVGKLCLDQKTAHISTGYTYRLSVGKAAIVLRSCRGSHSQAEMILMSTSSGKNWEGK